MPKYKNADIAQLAHQLTLSPRRQRLAQIAGAERLLELVKEEQAYPYDFVCYHLTGYRPLKPSGKSALDGPSLITDLVKLIEHLSQAATIPLSAIREPYQTQDELSQRLSVSIKTISRWRQRGLSGLRVVDQDRVSRLVFTQRSLQRFVAANRQLILRGGAFRQLTDEEREHLVSRARQLVSEKRLTLQEVARQVSEETGRAVETIRYTLRRFDQLHAAEALFGQGGRPRVPEQYTALYMAKRKGASLRSLSEQFGLSRRKIERICLEMQAYELLNRKINCVYSSEFEAADAFERILAAPEPHADPKSQKSKLRPAADAPAYLKALYDVPLLSAEQERDLFRRFNYCRFKSTALLEDLDPCKATRRVLNDIESYLQKAEDFQNRIIRANLRLVVNIASRHMRRGNSMFELISDGNMSLMRAVERFDYSRGFKFSTYASWAIIKNYARTIPEERSRYAKYVTGQDELLEAAPAHDSGPAPSAVEIDGVRAALAKGMSHLDEREREILTCHFGLNSGGNPTTLEHLGQRFGVTKERIRQIEKRALNKLRQVLSPSMEEFAQAS